jgi:hypothetical protein
VFNRAGSAPHNKDVGIVALLSGTRKRIDPIKNKAPYGQLIVLSFIEMCICANRACVRVGEREHLAACQPVTT